MVINFEEYSLNEKFGFPDSLEPVVSVLTEYMIDKMNWWTNRKGVANYTDSHHFDMRDFDPSIISNKDFPLAHINLKFSIVKGGATRTGIAGFAYPFKPKRYNDVDYDYSRIYRGKINMFLEFKTHILGKSIQIGKLREEAHTVIRHELQHMYETYQKLIRGVDMNQDSTVTNFNWVLLFDVYDRYKKCITFRRFFYLFYSISHEKEFNAFMSEFTSGKVKTIEEITAGNKAMVILKYDNFDKLYDEILKEFEKYYPNVDVESLPKYIIEETTKSIKDLKVGIPNWLKEYDKDFKGFLYQMWKRIQLKKEKFIKKSSKIFNSRKLLEFSQFAERDALDPYGEEDWEGDEINARKLDEEDERRRIEEEEIERRLHMVRAFIHLIDWNFDRENLSRVIIKNNKIITRVEGRGDYNDTFNYTYLGDTLVVRKTWGPMMKEGLWIFLNGIYEPEFPMQEANLLYLFFRNKWEN